MAKVIYGNEKDATFSRVAKNQGLKIQPIVVLDQSGVVFVRKSK